MINPILLFIIVECFIIFILIPFLDWLAKRDLKKIRIDEVKNLTEEELIQELKDWKSKN